MEIDKRTLRISVNNIDEGIKLCIRNALEFCFDAENLVKAGSCEHALGLCILAAEELGKARMLKEMSDLARKESKDVVAFERVEPELFFRVIPRNVLQKMGFNVDKKRNPFYNHLSKLLFARPIQRIAAYGRVMKNLEGKQFETIDEIFEKANELQRQTQEITPDLRETVFYVNYYQKEQKWRKGIEIDLARVKNLISDVRESLKLTSSEFSITSNTSVNH